MKKSEIDADLNVVLEILEIIHSNTKPTLPSIDSIARGLKVDTHKVSRAMQLLRERGYVQYRRGQRIRPGEKFLPKHEKCPPPEKTRNKNEGLYESLKSRIMEGSLRVHEQLPKRNYYALRFGISRDSVGRIYARLEQEELIRKKGRRWYVGKGYNDVETFPWNMPTILIMQPSPNAWRRYNNSRGWRFQHAFADQAKNTGVGLRQYVAHPIDINSIIPSGLHRLSSHVKQFESSYLGTIIVGRKAEYDDFKLMVHQVLSLGRPVVWFDYHEDTEETGIDHPLFYTCRFSEPLFSTCPLKILNSLGHRRIGYPSFAVEDEWQLRRFYLLKQAAERLDPPPRLVGFFDASDHILRLGPRGFTRQIEFLFDSGPPIVRTVLSRCIKILQHKLNVFLSKEEAARLLAEHILDWPRNITLPRDQKRDPLPREILIFYVYSDFIKEEPITALLFPRDGAARNAYKYLHDFGIRVPRDLSVVSYDNLYDAITLPVSTVDPGGTNLGYRAFHAIFGDIPVVNRKDRNMIIAQPDIDRRGTIGTRPQS